MCFHARVFVLVNAWDRSKESLQAVNRQWNIFGLSPGFRAAFWCRKNVWPSASSDLQLVKLLVSLSVLNLCKSTDLCEQSDKLK